MAEQAKHTVEETRNQPHTLVPHIYVTTFVLLTPSPYSCLGAERDSRYTGTFYHLCRNICIFIPQIGIQRVNGSLVVNIKSSSILISSKLHDLIMTMMTVGPVSHFENARSRPPHSLVMHAVIF